MKPLVALLVAFIPVTSVSCVGPYPEHEKLSENAVSSAALLNQLPSELLTSIIEMAPVTELFKHKFICKALHAAFKNVDMRKRLAGITGCKSLENVPRGEETGRLVKLLECFPWARLDNVYVPGSIFEAQYLPTANYAISNTQISHDGQVNSESRQYVGAIGDKFIEQNDFSGLFQLLRAHSEKLSGSRGSLSCYCAFIIGLLLITDPKHAVFVKMSANQHADSGILSSIMFTRENDENIAAFIRHIESQGFQPVSLIIYAIRTLAFLDDSALSTEHHAFMYNRNMKLIQKLLDAASSDALIRLDAENARLLTIIRFGSVDNIQDATIFNWLQVLCKDELRDWCDDGCELITDVLAAAVYARRHALFHDVWAMGVQFDLSSHLTNALDRHPDFIESLPVDYMNTLCDDLALKMVRFVQQKTGRQLTMEELQSVEPITKRLLLIAEVFSLDVFRDAVMDAISNAAKKSGTLDKLISVLVENFEDPVRLVNVVLAHLDLNNVQSVVSRYLGRENYLRALLKEANSAILLGAETDSAILLVALQAGNIKMTDQLAHALLSDKAMAMAINSPRARPIRERLVVPIMSLVWNRKLSDLQVFKLLKILGVPFSDLSFSVPIEEDMWTIHKNYHELFENGMLADLINLAEDPKFLSHLILCLCFESMPHSEIMMRKELNPFCLPCFNLLVLWYQSNEENFLLYAPIEVVRVFIPRSPESAFEEIMKANAWNERTRRLAVVYIKNQQVHWTFSSQEELDEFKRNPPSMLIELRKFMPLKLTCTVQEPTSS